MNKIKNVLIATLLLCVLSRSMSLTGQSQDGEDIIIGTISPETTQEESETIEKQTVTTPSLSDDVSSEALAKEEALAKSEAIAQWNAHLESLKEKDNYWNQNNNTPIDDWSTKAISLAKEALNQDKAIADSLKSAFFNTITEKIKIEEGEFTASTYALIKEFDDAIDAHAATLNKPTEETEIKIEEEVKPEPVVEQSPVTIEVETPALQPTQEIASPETTTPPATKPTDYLQEWNDQLMTITTTGNSEAENRNLLIKTYELAKELLSQGYTGESLYDGFTYAIFQHNTHKNLFPIKISQAIEAFNAETGIAVAHNQQAQIAQQEYNSAMKKLAEQQKQKASELKTAATVQEAIKRANVPASEMERLNKKLEERLALEATARLAQQRETDAKIAELKQQLASAHKIKTKEAPEEQGILSRAIGAVKGAASAATTWWYGGESQEEKDIKALDEQRLIKLQEILTTMPLTLNEKQAIENSWKTFIEQLRTFKKLDINDPVKTNEWLITVKQALERLTLTHNIISIADAMSIIKDAIKQYPDYVTLIDDIKVYLTEKQQRIIAAKQQQEDVEIKKIKERVQRKQEIELKKQRIRQEEECRKAAKNNIEAYKCEKAYWQKLLVDIAQHKDATEQDNSKYTNDAIQKAGSLLHPTQSVVVPNKQLLEQRLKEDFTNALLQQQQGNKHKINIYKNIDQFNSATNEM